MREIIGVAWVVGVDSWDRGLWARLTRPFNLGMGRRGLGDRALWGPSGSSEDPSGFGVSGVVL